ncbi:hypothetical protein P23_2641 [Acinetobacter calcoaceticus]|nr:hypothetical protein P23_2641 [Acinetobacter calcoaceticus]
MKTTIVTLSPLALFLAPPLLQKQNPIFLPKKPIKFLKPALQKQNMAG